MVIINRSRILVGSFLVVLSVSSCDAGPPDTYELKISNDIDRTASVETCSGNGTIVCAVTTDVFSLSPHNSQEVTAVFPNAGPWIVVQADKLSCLTVDLTQYPATAPTVKLSDAHKVSSRRACVGRSR